MPTTIINDVPALGCIYQVCFAGVETTGGVKLRLPVAPEFLIRGLLGLSAGELAEVVRVLLAGGDVVQTREASCPWLPNPVTLAMPGGKTLLARIDDFDGMKGVRVAVGSLKGTKLHNAIEFRHLHADGVPCFKLTEAGIRRVRESASIVPATSTMNRRPVIKRGTRAHNILVAMSNLGAVDQDNGKPFWEITSKAFGTTETNSFKDAMAKAKAAGCVESATGQNGGYWLTAVGVQTARAK